MPPIPKPIDILGSFQDPLNLDQGAGRLVNARVVPRTPGESKPGLARLVGSPGLTQVSQPIALPCVAICEALGTVWSAHVDTPNTQGYIYRDVQTATPVLAGNVAVSSEQSVIRLAEDRTALVITSNGNALNGLSDGPRRGTAYTATIGGGVVNAGFDASIDFDPSTCVELDNFALYSGASNFYTNQDSRMYRSQPLAPATVNGNWWSTKEARADRVIDLAVSGRVLWPLGARSLEQWYNSGADPSDTDFPFQAFPNSLLSVGLGSRLSLAVLRDQIIFAGSDKRIWLCAGQSGKPISLPWVDLLLQQLPQSDFERLTAYAYGQGGSDFYVLTLPGSWTLELASSTGIWSYRRTFGRNDHAGRCSLEVEGGLTYVGLDTGHICLLNFNSASEPAGVMPREITTPWIGPENSRTTFNSIDVTSSMGPAAGAFAFDWSEAWPAVWRGSRSITMPQPGTRRAIARNLGTGRRRQFRLTYTGTQAPFSIDELFADVTPGH